MRRRFEVPGPFIGDPPRIEWLEFDPPAPGSGFTENTLSRRFFDFQFWIMSMALLGLAAGGWSCVIIVFAGADLTSTNLWITLVLVMSALLVLSYWLRRRFHWTRRSANFRLSVWLILLLLVLGFLFPNFADRAATHDSLRGNSVQGQNH